MTTCLSEEALLGVHLGEAPAGAVRHAALCPRCSRLLASLRTDLGRIESLLRLPPPPVRRSAPRMLMVAPVFATAALALLLVVAHRPGPATVPVEGDGTVIAMVDDLSSALASADNDDAVASDDEGDDDDSTPRSTCSLDEPFLGVECENGVQLATLGW